MKKKFRYDYNNKVLVMTSIITLLFIILSIIIFENTIGFIICIGIIVINLLNTLLFIIPQGLNFKIRKNKLTIVLKMCAKI